MTKERAGRKSPRLIVGACLGNCVHVAGILNFLQLAEAQGYRTKFLGPATPIEVILDEVERTGAPIVALSYRLTPEAGYKLVQQLQREVKARRLTGRTWIFGGTTPVVEKVKGLKFFDHLFDGRSTDEDALMFLASGCKPTGGVGRAAIRFIPAQSLLERMEQKRPLPIIRHHLGLPSLEETIKAAGEIAESRCLDVISIAPDQNAQQFFFHPEQMDESVEGAGGVPVRSEEDFLAIYRATRRGNYPLLRCYSGTQDLLRMAEMLQRTIRNAWCATPINWYSVLDGRSNRPLHEAIRENIENLAWHGERGIPVEVNEPHHWSLRSAHDVIAVASAYWSAFIAKAVGVRDYIAQLMLNTPLGVSPAMDLAKMWAKLELVEALQDEDFRVYRQVRAGLLSFPSDLDSAKGQLASSTYTAMQLRPHIVHVVGFCEADHAATAEEIIASCKIARQVIRECLRGMPDYRLDPLIVQRKNQLVSEARLLLQVLCQLTDDDSIHPLLNPETYIRALKLGILDAPGLKGNPNARGELRTRIIGGACYAVDENGEILTEEERLNMTAGEKIVEKAKFSTTPWTTRRKKLLVETITS